MKAAQVLDRLTVRTSVIVRIAGRRRIRHMAYMETSRAAKANFYWGFATGIVFSLALIALVMVML